MQDDVMHKTDPPAVAGAHRFGGLDSFNMSKINGLLTAPDLGGADTVSGA